MKMRMVTMIVIIATISSRKEAENAAMTAESITADSDYNFKRNSNDDKSNSSSNSKVITT